VSPTGGELYYDAPLTQRRTGEPNDPVVAIDMRQGMDWMGNLGTLAEIAQHPEIAAKLAEGAKTAAPVVDRYLEQLINLGKPKTAFHAVGAGGGVTTDASGKVVERVEPTVRPVTPLQQSQIAVNEARAAKLRSGGGAVGLGAAPAATEPEDWTLHANIFLDTGKAPPMSTGRAGGAERAAFRKAVTEEAKRRGMAGGDVIAGRAEAAALTAAQRDLQKRQSAVDLFASKVERDMQTLDGLLDKASTGSPLLISKPINALRRQFSDSELAQLDLAAKQVGTEYERLITGGTLSVAQLHVGAQEDAKKLINGDMTPKQARAVMTTMRQEMRNAKDSAKQSLTEINEAIKRRPGAGSSAPATLAPAAVSAPATQPSKYREGQTATGPGGQRLIFRGGQWQPLQ